MMGGEIAPSYERAQEMLLKLVELGWGQDNPAFRQPKYPCRSMKSPVV